jgi:hypothetical protein
MATEQNIDRITDRREGNSIDDFLAKQANRDKTPEPPRDWHTIRSERRREVAQAEEIARADEESDKAELKGIIDFEMPAVKGKIWELEQLMDTVNENIDLLFKEATDDISDQVTLPIQDIPPTFPFHRQYCFGLTRTGLATYTLWDGYITHGSNAVITVSALTGITITADAQYVGISYDTTDGTVSLYSPSTTYPVSDGQYYRKAMYKFSFDGSVAKVIRTGGGVIGGGQPIDIPSRFGDRS